MTPAAILQTVGGIHFDATISFGNVLTFLALALATIKFWNAQDASRKAQAAAQRDLEWRIGNLEVWRKEHSVDADSRDHLIASIADIAKKLQWVDEARERQVNAPPGKRRLNDY